MKIKQIAILVVFLSVFKGLNCCDGGRSAGNDFMTECVKKAGIAIALSGGRQALKYWIATKSPSNIIEYKTPSGIVLPVLNANLITDMAYYGLLGAAKGFVHNKDYQGKPKGSRPCAKPYHPLAYAVVESGSAYVAGQTAQFVDGQLQKIGLGSKSRWIVSGVTGIIMRSLLRLIVQTASEDRYSSTLAATLGFSADLVDGKFSLRY